MVHAGRRSTRRCALGQFNRSVQQPHHRIAKSTKIILAISLPSPNDTNHEPQQLPRSDSAKEWTCASTVSGMFDEAPGSRACSGETERSRASAGEIPEAGSTSIPFLQSKRPGISKKVIISQHPPNG
jgi:hypothetical protein